MAKYQSVLRDNQISAQNISFTLSGILPETAKFALTGVRPVFHYDENRKRTDHIEAYIYTVTEMDTLSSFHVRVNSTTPVITPEELEEAEERVFIEFPTDETIVKPYKLEYGTATVSIVAPYAKLSPLTDSEED